VPYYVEYTGEVCRDAPKTFLEALDSEAKSREWNILGGSTRRVRGRGGLYTEDLTYGGRMYPPEVSGWWHPSVGRTRRAAEYGVRRAGRRCISGPRT